jgi:prophage regulatory protein
MNETYLSDTDLAQRFNLTRQTIWRWHRTNPSFPRAIALSAGCTRWKLSSIEAWELKAKEAA